MLLIWHWTYCCFVYLVSFVYLFLLVILQCLSILNYFRSIERTLTINDVGLTCSESSQFYQQTWYVSIIPNIPTVVSDWQICCVNTISANGGWCPSRCHKLMVRRRASLFACLSQHFRNDDTSTFKFSFALRVCSDSSTSSLCIPQPITLQQPWQILIW